MPPRDACTADLIARLVAAGLAPEVTEYADRTVVEAHLPGPLSEEAWPDVLAALEDADEFGSSDGGTGRRIWAVIRRTQLP
ncbi:hypothetical protein [Streptomyces sp. NRRL F-5123]|uniref:hypothetical protein n=1 Tax=Streptomyces sp. NRRL F-5123 TaxID=1463856 RepID=UPI0004E1E71C|nr:hypothetical protein [Streptomyces sp. NRRL F-5123]